MITYAMLYRQIILPDPSPAKLTPLLRHCCGVLPLFLRVASFVFNSLQPLLPKTGGWGSLAQVISDLARRTHRFFTPLFSCSYKTLFSQLPCFHIYTKRGVFFASWMEFAHSACPNQESSRRSSAFSAPACRRQACHRAGLSVIFILRIFRAAQTFQLSPVVCQPPF